MSMIRTLVVFIAGIFITSLIGCSGGGGDGGSGSDITAPTAPAGLISQATSSTEVSLSWNASTDNVAVTGYKVYRDGTLLNTAATLSMLDSGLTVSTTYCYQVSASDAAGNESDKSVQQCATPALENVTSNTASPISVTVTRDAARAAAALVSIGTVTIPAATTTITATGADGTIYTLSVPVGALTSDETITLTPVSSISGMPLSGGNVAGVHFEPEGLRLLEPATLTIQLPSAVPASGLISYGYTESGAEFYLYPSVMSGTSVTTISMSINHFSGGGVGQGTSADLAAMDSHSPSNGEDAAQQAIAKIAMDAKNSSGEVPPPEQLAPLLRQWFLGYVLPQLKAAETDDSGFACAVAGFLTWVKSASLLGAETLLKPEHDQGLASIKNGYTNAFKKSAERCVANNDPFEVGIMLQLAREAGLLGLDLKIADFETVMPQVAKCARFEVTVDSTIDSEIPGSYNAQTRMLATTHVVLDSARHYLNWSSPIVLEGVPEESGVYSSWHQWSGSVQAQDFIYDDYDLFIPLMNISLGGKSLICGKTQPALEFKDADLVFWITQPGWTDTGGWEMAYREFHPSERAIGDAFDGNGIYYAVTGFTKGTGSTFAEKTYDQVKTWTGSSLTSTEHTTITIKHAPVK